MLSHLFLVMLPAYWLLADESWRLRVPDKVTGRREPLITVRTSLRCCNSRVTG